MSRRTEDIKLLRALLELPTYEGPEDDDIPPNAILQKNRDAFADMLNRVVGEGFKRQEVLTDGQLSYATQIYKHATGEPEYENLFSSGKSPRGSYGKSETPEVLKKELPKAPPRKFEKKP